MPTLSLDFAADDSITGFRLQRLEVLNWGTFNRQVWSLGPEGHNALLTGDIGSGKSTLVDAITTLLVPHQRIVYNKAAGAEGKERSLYSYIRGEYKSAKDDLTQSAKAIALRDSNSYTVLLAEFYNQGFNQRICLAQVFWLKEQKRNPERFFVVSETPLSIAADFSNFGSDILELKKRLRHTTRVQLLDNFKAYSSRFRQLFGIQNEQALELFYQTVSMKSVGNLTDFVRLHMLEKGDVESRIDDLRHNFDNLNRAHEAVLKAKEQIGLLAPLVKEGRAYIALSKTIEELRRCREALVAYFAQHKSELLTSQIEKLAIDVERIGQRLERLKEELGQLRQQQEELKTAIDDSGGRRLQTLEQEIATLSKERDQRQRKEEEYHRLGEDLTLPQSRTADGFYDNLKAAQALLGEIEPRIEALKQQEIERSVDLQTLRREQEQLDEELDSLRRRKSNIPRKNLQLRQAMAQSLGLDEARLPFVGELLQVDEASAEWEGAIERLLHNFGLSLLVPEELYPQVSQYVDQTHLRGRLVYFRLRAADARGSSKTLGADSLARKIRIKPETDCYAWLETQLQKRFDYICCADLERFR
ncbi:MAG: ATP-dependent exonuclease SbcCD, C subunit-like protein, partial [Geopsychrobacter sp.]|nr:ATP-dependent exonuclease SbcCD, C subunit-like protein [Geopsychrobacter sp.]